MAKRSFSAILLAFTALSILTPAASMGQADPFWLRSWNEAQKSRPAQMSSHGRIASADEPGTPLLVHGQVIEPDGQTPAVGVVIHAYHRDRSGFDFGENDRAMTTWRLQGWAMTDEKGRFEFKTIRPAADHMGRDGAHIHFTLEAPGFGRQWAPTVYFADDPLVSENRRRQSAQAGEFGWVREARTSKGVQQVDVKIRLKASADF